MRSFAALALILAVASCEKSSKDDHDKKDEPSAKAGDDKGTATATDPQAEDPAKAGAAATGGTTAPAGMTGDATCDALITAMRCTWDKTPGMPASTKKMFEDGVEAWKQGLADAATKQSVIDGCKLSLDGGRPGFEQLGCVSGGGTGLAATGVGTGGGGTAVAVAGAFSSGAPECDELIARTMCSYKKAGAAMPQDAIQAFEDSVGAWKEALHNDATRQPTIDACKMSLDAAKDGFAATGCGDPDYKPYLDGFQAGGSATATATTTPPATTAVGPMGSVGEPTCDKLIERTMCTYQKAGSAVPQSAIKAFQDSVGAWKDALDNSATRQPTIDACKMSLDAANDGFKAMGC